MCHSLQITHRIVQSHLPGCHLKAVHRGEGHIEVCPEFICASCLASIKRGIPFCVAELKLNLKTCTVYSVTIQFRPSCNQTKNPEVIPGIFCIGMAEVV